LKINIKAKEQLKNELVEVCQPTVGLKALEAFGKRAKKRYGTQRTSPRHIDLRRIIPILDSKKLPLGEQMEIRRKEKEGA